MNPFRIHGYKQNAAKTINPERIVDKFVVCSKCWAIISIVAVVAVRGRKCETATTVAYAREYERRTIPAIYLKLPPYYSRENHHF